MMQRSKTAAIVEHASQHEKEKASALKLKLKELLKPFYTKEKNLKEQASVDCWKNLEKTLY